MLDWRLTLYLKVEHLALSIFQFTPLYGLGLAIAVYLLFYFSTIQPPKVKQCVESDSIYRFFDNKQYWTEITNYCCQDRYLYVLYQRKAILQVYDRDGNYESSYAFYRTNGRAELGIDEEFTYLADRTHNWYIFKDGVLLSRIPYSDYNSFIKIGKRLYIDGQGTRSSNDGYYYMHWASIYYHNNETGINQCIIKRPYFFIIYQGMWLMLLPGICLICASVLIIIPASTEKKEKGQLKNREIIHNPKQKN